MRANQSHWPLTLLGGGVSFLNMLLPLLLVRILPPDEIGQYKIYFLYIAIVPPLCMASGLMSGLAHWGGHDTRRIPAIQTSWTVLLVIALTVLTFGMLFNSSLQTALEWDSLKTHLLVFGAFATLLAGFFDEASIASGHILRGALFSSGFDFIRNFAMAAAAWHFRTLDAVLWAHVGVLATKLAIGATWGAVEGFHRPRLEKKIFTAVARYAMPVSISALFFIATTYSDQLLLSKYLEPAQFAIYTFGCLQLPPLLIFEQSVNRVLIPRMSRAFVKGDTTAARRLYRDAISELSWVLMPAVAGLILFANPIVELLFTKTYMEAAFFLKIFAFSYLFMALPYDVVDRARARGYAILVRLMAFSVISIVLIFFMLKQYGAAGALVGAVATKALMRLTALFMNRHLEGWPLKRMLPWADWLRYAGFVTLASLAALAVRSMLGETRLWLGIGSVVFVLVYGAGTYKMFRRRSKQKLDISLQFQ